VLLHPKVEAVQAFIRLAGGYLLYSPWRL